MVAWHLTPIQILNEFVLKLICQIHASMIKITIKNFENQI